MAYTTIDKPTDYFNTVLYTGTETSGKTVTGVGFQPDWIWIKNRTDASNHNIYDSVRGGNGTSHYWLKPNSTSVESTNTSSLLTIDSDGFTLGDGNEVNGSGDNIVSWNWLASNTTASNTDGSITSTVSANTTSGFSIVSYTGNGTAGATIGHGLGSTPQVIIIKNRSSLFSWEFGHSSIGFTKKLKLDTTSAEITDTGAFNNTAPTSSVYTVGNNSSSNGSGNNMIAYCFAEKKGFSRFGSYQGSGNSDGPMIWCGFKPAMIITKKTSASGDNWQIRDNKRDTFNEANHLLKPNASTAEATTDGMDYLSNGFKWRNSAGEVNASGATYIFMAFAESPFVTSTGIPTTAR